MKNRIRIGIDSGGTFTDFVLYRHGKISIKKVPSTPENPALAIFEGVKEILEKNHPFFLIHGTTVATNALLEKKGGRIAFLTTAGFEDILFIGRQVRKELYSLNGEQRIPLLSRNRCFGIDERTSASGNIEKKVALKDLEIIIKEIRKKKVEAVALSLINSYANPSNERKIRRELKKNNILTSVSTEILPEYREYERSAVTAVNAYLMPVMSKYIANLERKAGKGSLRIMQSNEGYISANAAKSEPIKTVLSGPTGGVVAAYHLSRSAGAKRTITFDMGGTSSDVSLIDDGISRTNENKIGEFPVRLPMIDIHTVGAGGGSIAYLDSGGSLRVGPQSAGAVPGPACYGHNDLPTVTDANLILGRLVPEFFLGGKMKIYPEKSQRAVEKISNKINKSIIDTASGIIDIANANMEKAIRVISVERGYDLREFSLFPFGGAGGMHAVEISAHLNMPKIIVPLNAGVLSALGLLLADSIKDYSRSFLKETENLKNKDIEEAFRSLEEKGIKEVMYEGYPNSKIRIFRFLDLRYLGQSYEITIPYRSYPAMIPDFQKAHQKTFSYHHLDQPVEIVNVRIKAIGLSQKIKMKEQPLHGSSPKKAFFKEQTLIFKGEEHLAPVYDRSLIEAGNRINGPSLVVDHESTAFIPPAFKAEVDNLLNLIIHKKK
jgi:N-methylhydantoinase A/oxoprolinase/acetone carboxylase beta subunit